jgi:hypothetical protein
MKRLILVFILLTLLLVPIHAQEDDEARAFADSLRVLNPSDVFVDSVEIIETLPELNSDGINPVLYYLPADSENWELLSPPDELSSYGGSFGTERLRNGSFEVDVIPLDFPCPPPTPIYEFDPATRLFTLRTSENYTPQLWAFWSFFYSNPPEKVRLRNYCQPDTFGAELPSDISDLIYSMRVNEQYNYGEINTPEYFIVYAFFPHNSGNYLFAIYTIADDAWSESFPLSLPGEWAFSSLAFQDGVLYFVARGETGAVYYALDIASKTFDVLFRTFYPQLVTPKQGDNLYYYIGYSDTNYQFYRYDLLSQQEEVIAEFPCAEITGSCMDINIVDANWRTEITDLIFILRGSETEEGFPHFVVDVTNAKTLYSSVFPSLTNAPRWLDNYAPRLLVSFRQNVPEPYSLLIDLNADNPVETQITVPYAVGDISPDEQNIVVYIDNEEDRTQVVGILNLETLAYKPVTLPLDLDLLGVRIFWLTDETLQVTVNSRDTSIVWFPLDPFGLRTWIIRP